LIPALLVHELLPLPQGAEEAPSRLPWPEGTVLSGRVEAGSDARSGVLVLAGRRMLAQLPPEVPRGEIWLQLMDRNIPARFRFLSQSQAETAVMRMLQKMVSASGAQSSGSTHGGVPADASREAQTPVFHATSPTAFEQTDTPYRFVPVGISPPRWLLIDEREESPRGMLKGEVDAKGFQLRGRLDLPNLGSLAFVLGESGNGMRLSLFSGSREGYQVLQSGFPEWLHQREEHLGGSLHMGLPDEERGSVPGPGYS
jgi:hypothetical protein